MADISPAEASKLSQHSTPGLLNCCSVICLIYYWAMMPVLIDLRDL